MDIDKFGAHVYNIVRSDYSQGKREELLIESIRQLHKDDFNKIAQKDLTEILYEFDRSDDIIKFGKLSIYIIIRQKMLYDLIHKNNKLEQELQEIKPKKRRRVILNETRTFYDGNPCIRCNNLANHFNLKGIKIQMPKEHPLGKCPLYCNICENRIKCEFPDEHLNYVCDKCETDYCNHPTEHCFRK